MKSLSIKKLIVLIFSIVITISIALSAYVLKSLNSIDNNIDVIVEVNVDFLEKVSDLRHYTLSYRRFALDYGLTENKLEHKKIKPVIEENRQLTLQTLAEFERIVETKQDKAFISTFRQRFSNYVKTQNHYIELIDQNKIVIARETILGPMLAPFNEMIKPVEEFQTHIRNDTMVLHKKDKKHLSNITTYLIVICAVLLIFTSGAGVLLSRKINIPLAKLNQQMQVVGKGDLSKEIDMSSFTKDELGDSAIYFNEMQSNVALLIKEISKHVASLKETSSRLNVQSDEVTHRIQNQQVDINDMSSSMGNMLKDLQEVANTTNSTAEVANDASDETNNGKQIVNQAVMQIENVSHSLEKASNVVNTLNENSANISSVTEVISAIAEQTNLLALNAAIEAARAGDQGRGFAVVADEVRTLAQRTQNSIDEITHTITSLQAKAEEAVLSMVQSKEGMDNSVEQAKLAGKSIADISLSVMRISESTKEIATATDEQTAITVELTNKATLVNKVSTKVSEGTLESQKLYSEITELSENINELTNRFST